MAFCLSCRALHIAHGNFTGIVNCLYLQLTHYTIMKFHSCHYKFYSACKSAINFTPNAFQFISMLSWNRSSIFLYCTMYFYMLLLSLHSKHMHLVHWNDFVNRYIVCIWYLLELHRHQFVGEPT